MTKVCNGCKVEKRLTEFSFHRTGRKAGKPASKCRICAASAAKVWREKNPEKCKQGKRRCYVENAEKNKAYARQWRKENPEKVQEANRKVTPEENRKRVKEYYARNPEARRESSRRYYAENREKCIEKVACWRRDRLKIDPLYKLLCDIRSSICGALGIRKNRVSIRYLGCTISDFRAHIEKQFWPGMSWENRGPRGWHLDHIKPCASFDLSDPAQQAACFHFSNMQPLWADDNRNKSDRLDWTPTESKHTH